MISKYTVYSNYNSETHTSRYRLTLRNYQLRIAGSVRINNHDTGSLIMTRAGQIAISYLCSFARRRRRQGSTNRPLARTFTQHSHTLGVLCKNSTNATKPSNKQRYSERE